MNLYKKIKKMINQKINLKNYKIKKKKLILNFKN